MTTPTPARPELATLVDTVLEELLRREPEEATRLGDHRYDDRLTDRSPPALDEARRSLARHVQAIDEIATARGLGLDERVDAAVLRRELERRLFDLEVLRTHEWDPMLANPGGSIHSLLARDFAPLGDRLRAVAGRLSEVPEHLAVARSSLGTMPRVHVETAIEQFTGTVTLLATELGRALAEEPALEREVGPARDRAVAALEDHVRWLRRQLPASTRDPRLGAVPYARKLALVLDTVSDPDRLLARAEHDLGRVEDEIAGLAARMTPGTAGAAAERVRAALDHVAATGPVDDTTIVGLCEQALEQTAAFVAERDLVTMHHDPVEIIVMPEIHRGVAVAYCDPPGPLESEPLPTYFAVSPTPEGWPRDRVASFYREYNAHMLHNLTVHEAMPGHALQLAHARRHRSGTPVRAAFWSGSFVEGWAVLAEELVADAGYPGAGSPDALRLQRLKMQLRMIINTILDVRVHCHGMTEHEAMRLMTGRGHQEEGEAAGKWRRTLLTSCQLPTYYVGYTELRDVRDDLVAARPGWSAREVNDALLAHGSPAPRHLPELLGLPPAP